MSRPFLTLADVQQAVGIPARAGETFLTGVSTDTRTLQPGSLFVALRGERFDGHAYVGKAFALGAAAAIVDQAPDITRQPCLVVPDTLAAYGQVAGRWREEFAIPVVGVTGSVGKTTMKEMTALALSPRGPVLKSERNENNEVGVPLTLLRLTDSHQAAVIEMGMRGAGQIRYLCAVARPTIGVVTVIGESHLELVGSRLGIADAKAELLEALPEDGIAVLNRDDPFIERLQSKTPCRMVTYGLHENADIHPASARRVDTGWQLEIRALGETVDLHLQSPARHDIANALGAIGCACAAGVGPAAAAAALAGYRTGGMRMEQLRTTAGAIVLSDCYNAAPTSVLSALQTLVEFPASGRRAAFLGDMRELGPESVSLHAQVAAFAGSMSIDIVFPVGGRMTEAFPLQSRSFSSSEAAAAYVREAFDVNPGDVVLVKGSRAMAMERIVEALTQP